MIHLPIVRQCQLLGGLRSSFHYSCQEVGDEELALMRLIDECHLKRPYYGSRRSAAERRMRYVFNSLHAILLQDKRQRGYRVLGYQIKPMATCYL